MRKRIVYIISAVLVITVFFVMISGCEASEEEYKHAIELLNEGKTDEAYEILTGLHGYADSMEIAENIFNDKYLDALSYARAGDIITFGNYEQDNKYADGEEPIEWQVLERAGDRILVISRYALDCIQYHSSDKDVTWEKSSIRRWLNRSFRSSAFDEIESSRIEETYLTSVSQMSDDPDYIFLLDEQETKKYFKEWNREVRADPTLQSAEMDMIFDAADDFMAMVTHFGNAKYFTPNELDAIYKFAEKMASKYKKYEPFFSMLDFCKVYGERMRFGDFAREANWGVVIRDGEAVPIPIDFGFTKEVAEKYY